MRYGLIVLMLGIAFAPCCAVADEPPDTQRDAPALSKAEEVARAVRAPAGFRVSVFASEPLVRQPIAMTTDARGRLWVAENYTYAVAPTPELETVRDRIICLSDTDHDGRADERTVFWDDARELTSIEIGAGGLWALCPPRLLFLPDRDGDDRIDGPPQTLLEGFDLTPANRHNFANGLKWGPDGWLYGRNGITHVGHVGAPGAEAGERVEIGPGIWRFHPQTHQIEMVAVGTTNPWGHDWDRHGELFFINTVIGHLWHAVPGAHFRRMFGADSNPYVYQLIEQTADHFHWDTAEKWNDIRHGVTDTTDQAGGGHAHSGLLIYQGDQWPAPYRGAVLTINLHGRRLNVDHLERAGASYVAHHGQDQFFWSDPWFRGIELLAGPDGGVYVADWTDVGECHELDGVHRSSGRIFKIDYGTQERAATADLARLDNLALVELLKHENVWFARQAQRLLTERAAAGGDFDETAQALRRLFDEQQDVTLQLRAMWTLYTCGAAPEGWMMEQLAHADEHVRTWGVRLLVDRGAATDGAIERLAQLAKEEKSGLVLLYLASALQKLPAEQRPAIAGSLAAHEELADDREFPLLLWYGCEAATPLFPEQAVKLAVGAEIPLLRRFIARRLTQEVDRAPAGVAALLEAARASNDAAVRRDLVAGMAEGLRGRRRAPRPENWQAVASALEADGDAELRQRLREMAVVFGDGVALDELKKLAASAEADMDTRRSAVEALAEARAEGCEAIFEALLGDGDLAASAVRGLASFDNPAAAELIVRRFPGLIPTAQDAALETLTARPTSALALLRAIEGGAISREFVSIFQVRQMQAFEQPEIQEKLRAVWPELRPISADKQARIAEVRGRLTPESLGQAKASRGRRLWDKSCAKCHTLFGEGGKIGPDLTGAQRSNLAYLLENVIDPSATLAPGFRMSTVALTDGRVIQGVILSKTEATWEVQTPTDKLSIDVNDIDETADSTQSLMPEGLMDLLTPEEIRDLVAYLMSQSQVAPAEAESAR